MAKKLFRVLFYFLLPLAAQAQTGTLKGTVKNEAGNALAYASISVQKNGQIVSGTQSNENGEFTIKPLNPGLYDVVASYVGFQSEKTEGVQINVEKITFLDVILKKSTTSIDAVVFKRFKVPLIDPDFKSGGTKTAEDIIKSPLNNISAIASTVAGIYSEDNGSNQLNIRGARSDATLMYMDGVKVNSSANLSRLGMEQITVITGGMPARYGDATGGLLLVTSKNPSRKHEQSINYESSQFLDAYGTHELDFAFLGPLYKPKDKDFFLGYSINGKANYAKDASPSAVGAWKVKDDVLADLQQNPLAPNPSGQGTIRRAELLTKDDLEWSKAHQNTSSQGFAINSKLEIKATKRLSFSGGAYVNYNTGHGFTYQYSLLNPENNPYYTYFNWRTYGKMTHKIGIQDEDLQDVDKMPLVKNMYYTVQVDFNRASSSSMDDSHGSSLFDYGYIGKFKTTQEKTYVFDSTGANGPAYYMQGWKDTEYSLDTSSLGNNASASRYTQSYYDLYDGFVSGNYENYAQVQNGGALLNGDRPQHVYDIWYNTGRQSNGYSKSQSDQFRVVGNWFADVKHHEINVGFEYEQRVERAYSIAPMGLWTLARQLANAKNSELNKSDSTVYGDTVDYNRLYVPTLDANGNIIKGFFENVREELGVSNTDFVDSDNLTPQDLSLSMFNAGELLQSGNNSLYSASGYDYLGNSSKASFGDFFTKTDGNNALLRATPAFQPIYMSGYIQDKFVFHDIILNVGVRIDRFDANQMVPRDLYSLYPIKTAAEAKAEGISIPSSVGDNYKVYINDQDAASKTALGFRDENDNWYNSEGTEIQDPSVIASASTTGTITPYLKDPKANVKSNDFDYAASFKKYEAQFVVMPRISFSFPISDEAMFFTHYDLLAQRPNEGAWRNDPTDYLFMENMIGTVVNNPGLKPQKTTDYELGFAQRLSRLSAITVSAFYREIRDMIQVKAVNYAYPVSYVTYQNVDFGTVKGLSLNYDLRRTRNAKLTVNYTLQFAEGTGSSAGSSINIINSGSPNLRTIVPLDFDRRHNINFDFDYRYGRGKNYEGPSWGRKILAEVGLNFLLRTGSGTPYSKQSNITEDLALSKSQSRTLYGQINGSRLPWSFRIDIRADKNFVFKFGDDSEKQKVTVLNAYFSVENLLDTRNVINVYRYTGNPDDDGFLTAAVSQQEIDAKVNPQSYIDLYSIAINSPNNYSLPRLIKLGAIYNF